MATKKKVKPLRVKVKEQLRSKIECACDAIGHEAAKLDEYVTPSMYDDDETHKIKFIAGRAYQTIFNQIQILEELSGFIQK